MPTIDDLKIKQRSKKFEKIAYRPWETDERTTDVIISNPITTDITNKTEQLVDSEHNSEFIKIFRSLYGLQKNLMVLLCNKISHEDGNFSYTSALTIHELVEYTRSTKASISATLLRLKQKKFLFAHENKTGRGGFASFKIDKALCAYIKLNSVDAIFKK